MELKRNNRVTIKELGGLLTVGETKVKYVLKKLKENGQIERIGSTKSGYWEVK